MAASWTLTVRDGPRVERVHCDSLDAALGLLEQRIEELAPGAHRDDVQVLKRRFGAADQVTVRAEIAAPGGLFGRMRGGIDLHGDGTAEAYTGRLRRTDIELGPGESPLDGLRRALGGAQPAPSGQGT
jgi:hypothetical protein